MKNFPITSKEDGKVYWVSRAMAVCAIILAYDKDYQVHVFLQKRGPECPDFVGAWAHTCGYLDFDESLHGALEREVFEEIGLNLKDVEHRIIPHTINDAPGADPRQNVTVRYVVQVRLEDLEKVIDLDSESRGGEDHEVSEYQVLPVENFDPGSLEFAFNHRDLTTEILCDTRFFQTQKDKMVTDVMGTRSKVHSSVSVFGTLYDVIITTDFTGIVKIVCPDLGIVMEPDQLPLKVLSEILERVVFE